MLSLFPHQRCDPHAGNLKLESRMRKIRWSGLVGGTGSRNPRPCPNVLAPEAALLSSNSPAFNRFPSALALCAARLGAANKFDAPGKDSSPLIQNENCRAQAAAGCSWLVRMLE